MVAVAVIVAPGGTGLSPLAQLGGLSLLKRAVLTVQKAGVARCYICTDLDWEDLQHELQDDGRVTSQILWRNVTPADGLTTELDRAAQYLVFTVDTIFRHPLVRE